MDILKLEPILNGNFLSVKIFVNDEILKSEGNVPELFNIKRPIRNFGDTENHPIFNCSCGVYMCGGIEMKISSSEDNIIWRMFKPQKFSFIFDKAQYSNAFKQFQTEVKELIKDREDLQENKFFISLLK